MFSKALFLALIPSILAANIAVTVGADNGFTFTPTSVAANAGDDITFTVVSRNHSITSTNFSGAVCPPPVGGVGPNGFDSGFLSALDGSQPTFTYTVVDTEPHWVSCMQAAGAHCRAGMTFAINPTADQTYEEFLFNAEHSLSS
ncbi:Cupredoxin [Mycena crocata]|nr:Cupredoxin [Mycena crocata]